MASYLYIVEMATTGAVAEPDTGQWASTVLTAFNEHPEILQYKCLVGNWAGLSNGTQFFAPIPWSVIMFVQETSLGPNPRTKQTLDDTAIDIMQQVKTAYPNNVVVGIDFEVHLLPSLF